jgi:hypothetical protein
MRADKLKVHGYSVKFTQNKGNNKLIYFSTIKLVIANKAYIIINFRIYKINQAIYKLIWIPAPTLIKKANIILTVKHIILLILKFIRLVEIYIN